jgi:DNA repair ATPase RecN
MRSSYQQYFDTLGLSSNSTEDEVNKKYDKSLNELTKTKNTLENSIKSLTSAKNNLDILFSQLKEERTSYPQVSEGGSKKRRKNRRKSLKK